MRCVHCGREIGDHPSGGSWSHIYRSPGDKSVSRLNRCQSVEVPYGHEAHPAEVPCPEWCSGHYEAECAHLSPSTDTDRSTK